MKSLVLRWILPGDTTFTKKKSISYISHVIGHEGPNSLLSCLIEQNLATNLTCGSTSRMNGAIDQFSISISLTDKGEKEYHRVMEIVYMFINKIRESGAAQ